MFSLIKVIEGDKSVFFLERVGRSLLYPPFPWDVCPCVTCQHVFHKLLNSGSVLFYRHWTLGWEELLPQDTGTHRQVKSRNIQWLTLRSLELGKTLPRYDVADNVSEHQRCVRGRSFSGGDVRAFRDSSGATIAVNFFPEVGPSTSTIVATETGVSFVKEHLFCCTNQIKLLLV